jgi:hypothetical protein
MNRKLKALGLTFVALLALAGFSSMVMAAEFHSETAHTTISGEQPAETNDVFTVKAGTVTCKSATYAGTTTSATTSEITVTPTYTECTAFGFVGATIDVPGGNKPAGANGGCDYRFTPSTATSQLHIVCGAGEFITVTTFNCDVHVGSQTATGITYTNAGSGNGRDVTVNANITGLTYTQTNTSFPFCTGGAGTFTDGKYVGKGTVFGKNTAGEAVGVWHE